MVFQSIGFPKWADQSRRQTPRSSKQQMQSCPQLDRQFCEPLQGQQIRTAFVGVTAMAEALQLFEL